MPSLCLTVFSPYFIEVLCILMDRTPRRASARVAYKGRRGLLVVLREAGTIHYLQRRCSEWSCTNS